MACTENRAVDLSGVEDLKPEEAWAKLAAADKDRELDDFREVRQNSIGSREYCNSKLLTCSQGLEGVHQICSRDHL